MNLRSKNTAIEDEDYYYHVGPLLAEDPSPDNGPRKESTKTPYHIKQCALSRVLEGEAAMAFNEDPKGSVYEREGTLRYKMPAEDF